MNDRQIPNLIQEARVFAMARSSSWLAAPANSDAKRLILSLAAHLEVLHKERERLWEVVDRD